MQNCASAKRVQMVQKSSVLVLFLNMSLDAFMHSDHLLCQTSFGSELLCFSFVPFKLEVDWPTSFPPRPRSIVRASRFLVSPAGSQKHHARKHAIGERKDNTAFSRSRSATTFSRRTIFKFKELSMTYQSCLQAMLVI